MSSTGRSQLELTANAVNGLEARFEFIAEQVGLPAAQQFLVAARHALKGLAQEPDCGETCEMNSIPGLRARRATGILIYYRITNVGVRIGPVFGGFVERLNLLDASNTG